MHVDVRFLHGRYLIVASHGDERVARAVDHRSQVGAAVDELTLSLETSKLRPWPPRFSRMPYVTYSAAEDALIAASWATDTPAEIAAKLPRPPGLPRRCAESVYSRGRYQLGLGPRSTARHPVHQGASSR